MKKYWIALFLALPALVFTETKKTTALTIYNDNLGVISQTFPLSLKSGKNEIRVTDVAALIDPTSVSFQSLSSPEKLGILEQNYQYDLVSPSKLLERYIDESIRVFTVNGKLYSGKLLSFNGSDIAILSETGINLLKLDQNIQNIEFPSLPDGLITKPTLVWLLQNEGDKNQNCRLSYMTGGLSWHAEYTAVLDNSEKSIDLGSWVSIDNNSGATYQDASLKLIAGTINRAVTLQKNEFMTRAGAPAPEAQFQEKSFFEYHLYTLARPSTVRDREQKQITLFPNTDVKIKKIYVYEESKQQKNVMVNLEFDNSKSSGLGMALPAGKIRVFKKDDDGTSQFIGEDTIDHTPKDEPVRLNIGNAFDIAVEKAQKSMTRVTDRIMEYTYEIKIRNHKKDKIEVLVLEHFYNEWSILKTSVNFLKKDSRTAEFKVPVSPDNEAVLLYTVRVSW